MVAARRMMARGGCAQGDGVPILVMLITAEASAPQVERISIHMETLKWTKTCRLHGRNPHAQPACKLANTHTANLQFRTRCLLVLILR